jgi:formate dehydrogenase assembly factor FdhD
MNASSSMSRVSMTGMCVVLSASAPLDLAIKIPDAKTLTKN